jgi:16S rRNA (uracil1498-N3)-methyltransferase
LRFCVSFASLREIKMQLPFFYIESYDASAKTIVLDEDTSRHVVNVLRMKEGEQLNLTEGKGNLITAEITDAHKKHCKVSVQSSVISHPPTKQITIAISLLKNSSRFEWFLEKATEIGVSEIIPLICERTEKQKFRYDRMKGICISAMLQSQQIWLPVLHEPQKINQTIQQSGHQTKLIAHCMEKDKQSISQFPNPHPESHRNQNSLILIGPEGDFTKEEIEEALQNNFIPVSLGETRLRTETAGIVAAASLIAK